ncbi:S-methyl-5-thioribose kinase [Oceaniglobus indicus]|uniref:S-methyl-5-thioribose kinase n=1 Tax=Oceaniglobus indicus TaxID=2047749 RepID=UPI000C18AD4E|nr:S-methyl-5-thioribose kinase [Oceaniglobus indicus]
MTARNDYEPLSEDSLRARIGAIADVAKRLGNAPEDWGVREVGDGNLNLVFIVDGADASVIVKQALPYVRLVGDSWPLPLYRAYFEHEALSRQAVRDPGSVPEIYHFDPDQALIVMEFLSPHTILRQKLIRGETVAGLADFLGDFCARTAFRGSELSMDSGAKKADVAIFAGNVAIPAITEALVFTDPYFAAEMNHHTPGLDGVIARLRGDVALKIEAQRMLQAFASNTETMVHGDLHSGSLMCTDAETKVIDPEFAQYGPLGFDIGMLIANLLMAYFSQPGHRDETACADMQGWILSVIDGTRDRFNTEFRHLWSSERTGMLYPATLFEDQGHDSTPACDRVLKDLWADAMGIAGIEMHRRCLSLAHNADFEDIEDPAIRAPLEARNLMMGRELVLSRFDTDLPGRIGAIARRHNEENFL